LCLKGFVPLFAGDIINFRNIVDKIFQKARDGKERIYRPKIRIAKGENIITFPGVDEKLGLELVKYFGSVKSVVNAPLEELMKIPGIGEKTARKIIAMVN